MNLRAALLWASADIRSRRWSLVALAALVALPVGFSLALVAGAQRAGASIDRFTEASGLGDVVVFIEGEPDAELLDEIGDGRITAIERANPVVVVPSPMEPGEFGYALVGTDDAPVGFGSPMLLSGRYPQAAAAGEIAVNERAAELYGFEVGMRVPLHGLVSFESFESRPLGEATIVGIVRTVFDLVDDPSTESFAIAGPGFIDGAWRDFARPGTILFLQLADHADIAAVVSDLSTVVGADGDVRGVTDTLSPAERAADLQRRGLLVAAAVVAVAGLLVVTQGVARHLAGRSADVDVLAAIGMTPSQRRIAAVMNVAPALAGGIVAGAALAVSLSPVLPLGLPRRADPDVGLHADAPFLTLGLLAALLVVGTATAIGVWRWLSPADEGVADRPALAARVATAIGLRPVALTGSRLALDGGKGRRRVPAIATLVALAVTTGAATAALIVGDSLHGLVTQAERYGQPWDVFVWSVNEVELADAGRLLSADPRVAGVDIARQGELDVTAADGTVTQVGAAGLDGASGPVWLAVLDGRAPGGPAEIALASRTMAQLGLGVGDTTTVRGACGERLMTVVGRAVVPLVLSGDPDHGSIVSGAAFEELCAAELIGEVDAGGAALVRLADPATTDAVLGETFPHGYYAEPGMVPSSVTSLAEVTQVPPMIAALVTVLGVVAAANALVLTTRRRGGDLAVLRALGLRPVDVRRAVGWQALTMAAIAAVMGIPIGVVLGRLVWTSIARPANVLIRVDVNPLHLLVVTTALLAILVALSIWPGRRTSRLNPAEVLRSE